MTPITLANATFRLQAGPGRTAPEAELLLPAAGWSSGRVPLVRFEVLDRMQERTERIDHHVVVQQEVRGQGLHLTVRDRVRGITIGVWLTLEDDGELSILVPPAEVEEADDALYRLASVQVLPGVLSASGGGRLLLPVNTGVLCSPAGKPRLRDRFLIYGEQERWELMPTLPLCGVEAGRVALVALATQGACDMACDVATDGLGGGTVGLHPMFRRLWRDPVDWTHREIRILALPPGRDLVGGAAKRLRRHVREALGRPTLRQRAEESPSCAYQQRAYTMKLFHGIQRQGIMMQGSGAAGDAPLFVRTMSFDDAARNLRRLKAAGIDRVYLQSVGWNPKGHDGAWPTILPVEHRLGGEAGLRAMIGTAGELGYQVTGHLNVSCCFFKSPDFHPDHVIHDECREPRITGCWGGGANGKHWGLALPDGFLETRMQALRRLGFTGMSYLDGIGNPLYVNHHRVHGGPRSGHAAGINRFLDVARGIFGAVATEVGFGYCAPHADAVCTGGSAWHLAACHPDWPVTALLDQRVPVWQLAFHDLVTCENQGLEWKDTMRAILFGEVPRDEWAAEPGVMPLLDDARIARIKARYDLCCGTFQRLVREELTDWTRLGDQRERTRFADGTEVEADFAAERLTVDGEPVPRPA